MNSYDSTIFLYYDLKPQFICDVNSNQYFRVFISVHIPIFHSDEHTVGMSIV